MRKSILIASVLLLLQAGAFYGLSRGEAVPQYKPFDSFPVQLGGWHMVQQETMKDDVKEVLKADDYISRWYQGPLGRPANLFVAFFKSQRAGQAPHSPKNCLPGSGWVWTVSDVIPVEIPGRAEPIYVNRYAVQNGDTKAVTLYWYQSRDRVVASEYRAKVYVVADALRYNRTDTALVRIWVPVSQNDEQAATQTGVKFIQATFPTLRSYLPQ